VREVRRATALRTQDFSGTSTFERIGNPSAQAPPVVASLRSVFPRTRANGTGKRIVIHNPVARPFHAAGTRRRLRGSASAAKLNSSACPQPMGGRLFETPGTNTSGGRHRMPSDGTQTVDCTRLREGTAASILCSSVFRVINLMLFRVLGARKPGVRHPQQCLFVLRQLQRKFSTLLRIFAKYRGVSHLIFPMLNSPLGPGNDLVRFKVPVRITRGGGMQEQNRGGDIEVSHSSGWRA
jgi:hypothetical protein